MKPEKENERIRGRERGRDAKAGNSKIEWIGQ
jgi:hypothetical protein